MGRKTFDLMPNIKKRTILVASRKTSGIVLTNENGLQGYCSKEYTPEYISRVFPDIWICGGAEIYELFYPHCEEFYLTTVNQEVSGDTKLPEFNLYYQFNRLIQHGHNYKIEKYIRR